jgi:hypothetical protein
MRVHVAEIVPGVRVGRIRLERPLHERERLVGVADLKAQHAEEVRGVGVVRELGEERAVRPLGCGQLARPMFLHRRLEALARRRRDHRRVRWGRARLVLGADHGDLPGIGARPCPLPALPALGDAAAAPPHDTPTGTAGPTAARAGSAGRPGPTIGRVDSRPGVIALRLQAAACPHAAYSNP